MPLIWNCLPIATIYFVHNENFKGQFQSNKDMINGLNEAHDDDRLVSMMLREDEQLQSFTQDSNNDYDEIKKEK